MKYLGLVEVILVFGAVLAWSWYEYRKADRLSKSHGRKDRETDSEISVDEDSNTSS